MRLQKRRVLGSTVLGLGAALAIAGCGAGQITQTDTQQPAVNGAYGQVGKLSIRNASLANRNECEQAYTPGSNAPLILTVANEGGKDDELVSVTSEYASGATVEGDKLVVAGSALVIGPSAPGESEGVAEQAAAAPSSTAPASSSAKPGAQGTVSTQQQAPEKKRVGHATVVLQGLKATVWPAQTIKVTFTFRDAGPVTVDLPIAAPTKKLECRPSEEHAPPAEGH
ncbi:hypothetical protein [Amycolatopsis anabasis]|uniref:hypothetical protein n=1 Tax=Amycolatopsis anabasis TaxID=1840409 RepID=UPI00131C16C3|nr:hypothetical protein [Amycolatopsis anabasis]